MKHALVVTTAAVAALLLSGCGGSAAQTQAATSSDTPSAQPGKPSRGLRRRNGYLCRRCVVAAGYAVRHPAVHGREPDCNHRLHWRRRGGQRLHAADRD